MRVLDKAVGSQRLWLRHAVARDYSKPDQSPPDNLAGNQ
jgi:hypothetical protein